MYLSHNIVNAIVRAEKQALTLKLRLKPIDLPAEISLDKDAQILFYLINDLDIKLTQKDAKEIVKGRPFDTKDFRGVLVENVKSALSFVRQEIDADKFILNEEYLLRINMILGLGVVSDAQLKYRESGEQISKIFDDLSEIAFESQAQEKTVVKTQLALDEFVQSSQHDLYKISLLGFNLLKLHPFQALNKYTIMLLLEVLLGRYLKGQYDMFNLAELFIQQRKQLIGAIKLPELPLAQVSWHELFISYLAQQLANTSGQLLLQNLGTESSRFEQSKGKPLLDLNKRQLKILKYLQTIPTLKREDYVEMMNVSAMTAYRDLQQLVDNKLIRIHGIGRGTKYMLASR